jgi:molybdenum cofactor biosynthesis protein MoaC
LIDVSQKTVTLRTARACADLTFKKDTADLIRSGRVPKGNPLEVAKVAAVQAAKNSSDIIPYCHPLPLDFVGVELDLHDGGVRIEVTVRAMHRTGVEMEALTAATVAGLTLYDMLKFADKEMEIHGVKLLEKTGGRSQYLRERPAQKIRAAVLVLSDTVHRKEKEDRSGKRICERLVEEGVEIADYDVLPDDRDPIRDKLVACCDSLGVDLVLTTGGSGLGPRDNTPEALLEVIDREAPGIPEAIRAFGQNRTPYAMLSRSRAGIRGKTLIISLAGSEKAVAESMNAIFPGVLHAFPMIRGEGH